MWWSILGHWEVVGQSGGRGMMAEKEKNEEEEGQLLELQSRLSGG